MSLIPGLRGVRALVSVANQGSVSGAAEALSLSQSAISRAIQDAEQQLEVVVFERHHAGMVCTELGSRVIHRCGRALDQFRRAEETLSQLQPTELTGYMSESCRMYASMGAQASAAADLLRLLFGYVHGACHVFTRADNGIEDWDDLAGKNVYIS